MKSVICNESNCINCSLDKCMLDKRTKYGTINGKKCLIIKDKNPEKKYKYLFSASAKEQI